jgi:regulator of sigma E protease
MGIVIFIEFVASLAILIIIHELGHFLAAKLFKVEVEEFGIGFPPRLLTFFKAGGTIFSLNAIPLGGFVRPKGENDPTVEGGLAAAKPLVRIGVFLAGPMANILTAILLYTVIFVRIGAPDPARANEVLISVVAQNSPAASAGLQVGDVITKVNGEVIDSTQKLHDLVYANLGKEMIFTYQRSGQEAEVKLTPRENPPQGEGAIGIVMGTPTMSLSPLVALPEGVRATYAHSKALIGVVGNIIQGQKPQGDARLVGYKGMFDIYENVRTEDASSGYPAGVSVLSFLTSISISLGLLNLLPIPALDGGRILFVLPELLFKKRIPQKYENVINAIGFTFLLILLLFINLQDFINPIQIPK